MASSYPSVVATLTYPNPSQTLNSPSHSSIHGAVNDEIMQIETFVGTSSSVQGTLLYDVRSPNSQGGGHVQGVVYGGTGQVTYTKGDILIASSPSVLVKLAVGTDGTVLTARSTASAGVDWEGTTVPTGAMLDFAGSAAPTGYLLCDGSAVSRTTYSVLYGVIGSTWGGGDGSTTFNVPDSRSRVSMGKGTGVKSATISSVASGTGVITVTGLTNAANNEYQTGQAIVFTSSVAGNLSNGATYYAIRSANNQIKVASTLANAQNGTNITLAGNEAGSFLLTFTTRTLADTGGEENHAMSSTELLSHSHTVTFFTNTAGLSLSGTQAAGQTSIASGTTGGNTAMNNLDPFYVVTKIIKT